MKIDKTLLVRWLLFFVLILAAFLRLWKLGTIPPHLTPDEAALGYNAYSILKTGKDEYGEFLPIIFKSFGDYKPGLYVYLTVPFVAFFGLNEYTVRLPSAIFGIIAVYLIYKIVNLLMSYELPTARLKKIAPSVLTHNIQTDGLLPTISALLLSISPWHIQFSRGAWEANVSLTLTLAGIYFFLKSFKNSRFLILASIYFSSTLAAYQGAKLATLIVVFALVVAFWKEAKLLTVSSRRSLAGSMLIGILLSLPIILSTFQGKTGRLNVFSVFSYPRPREYLQNFLNQGNEKVGDINYLFFHPETLNFARGIMGRWFNHFSGKFLFFEGDWPNPRHSAPNHGMTLLSDIFLLILGFIGLLKTKEQKLRTFLLIWFVLAPFPAALSRDQVHAVRSFNMVVPLSLITAFGVVEIIVRVRGVNKNPPIGWIRYAPVTLLIFGSLIYVLNYIYFLDSYFIHLSKHNSKVWSYGYKQIVETLTPVQEKYEKIKVQQSFAQPYIYFLFYQKYSPSKYQKQANLVESQYRGDVGYIEKLDNIEFSAINWPLDLKDHESLIVGDYVEAPVQDIKDTSEFNLIRKIDYLNG